MFSLRLIKPVCIWQRIIIFLGIYDGATSWRSIFKQKKNNKKSGWVWFPDKKFTL